jgi:inner membrane protein
MDSLTHIALGGLIGEAFAGKELGKRALIWGAMAQSLPDIDFIASAWLDTPSDLLAHRGVTHSFLFVAVTAPLLAWAATRLYGAQLVSFKKWLIFFSVQISIHLLIDSLNAYGTGWLEPFAHQRFSFHVLFVADPFFSVWLGISFFMLVVLHTKSNARMAWTIGGLSISSIYLLYAFSNKYSISSETEKSLHQQHIPYTRYFTTPTPLNNWLWYVVVEDRDGFQIGYRSVVDKGESLDLQYVAKNDSLLKAPSNRYEVEKLIRFSQGYYAAELQADTLVFSDLRFGQRIGWYNPKAKFVFRYYLNPPSENEVIIQRGRFADWDMVSVRALMERARGIE